MLKWKSSVNLWSQVWVFGERGRNLFFEHHFGLFHHFLSHPFRHVSFDMLLANKLNHVLHFLRNNNFPNFTLLFPLASINLGQYFYHYIAVLVHSSDLVEIVLIFNQHPISSLFVNVHEIVLFWQLGWEILLYLCVEGYKGLFLV